MEINRKTQSFWISFSEFNNVVLQDEKRGDREVLKRSLMSPMMRHNQSKWQTMRVNRDYVCVAYTHQPHHSVFLSFTHTHADKTHNDAHSSALSANWRTGSAQGLLFYYSYFPLFSSREGINILKIFPRSLLPLFHIIKFQSPQIMQCQVRVK